VALDQDAAPDGGAASLLVAADPGDACGPVMVGRAGARDPDDSIGVATEGSGGVDTEGVVRPPTVTEGTFTEGSVIALPASGSTARNDATVSAAAATSRRPRPSRPVRGLNRVDGVMTPAHCETRIPVWRRRETWCVLHGGAERRLKGAAHPVGG
jgi:hypothetical protein